MEFPSILQLTPTGLPVDWINYEDSAYYYAKGLVAWDASPVTFTLRGGTNAATGKQSTLTMNTIIAVRHQDESGAKNHIISMRVPLNNRMLFRRDRHLCAYCGQTYEEDRLTRDHVIPTSRGGPNSWTNVVAACEGCNKLKDDRTPEQAHMQLLYVPYEPSRNEYLILKNRRILADQMQFLLKGVPTNSRLHQNLSNLDYLD